ncbi:unnamed protein product [Penicillium viridicatum]
MEDSPLSTTANISGILTFLAAVFTFVYVRYNTLQNGHAEMNDIYESVKATIEETYLMESQIEIQPGFEKVREIFHKLWRTEINIMIQLAKAIGGDELAHKVGGQTSIEPDSHHNVFKWLYKDEVDCGLVKERWVKGIPLLAVALTTVRLAWNLGATPKLLRWYMVRKKVMEKIRDRDNYRSRLQSHQLALLNQARSSHQGLETEPHLLSNPLMHFPIGCLRTIDLRTFVEYVLIQTVPPNPQGYHSPTFRDNPIGFEWILMTKLPGKPFGEIYQSLSFDVKARLVRELAASSACLFRNRLCGIGNIYGESSVVENSTSSEQISRSREPVDPKNKIPVLAKESDSDGDSISTRKSSEAPFNLPGKGSSEGASPDVGRVVSMHFFFWDSHIHQDVYRGPFRSNKDWITARLLSNENDCHSALDKHSTGDLDSDDEAEVEDATRTLQIIDNLKSLVLWCFQRMMIMMIQSRQ